MTTIPDVQLYAHTERLRNKVVLITGKKDVLWPALLVFSSPTAMQGVRPASGERLLCNMRGRSMSSLLLMGSLQWLMVLDMG